MAAVVRQPYSTKTRCLGGWDSVFGEGGEGVKVKKALRPLILSVAVAALAVLLLAGCQRGKGEMVSLWRNGKPVSKVAGV